MRNYQRHYYQRYFAMLPSGEETVVTRRQCFAPAEDPTPANPYKQRWFYDPEASYAIRLPRNPTGDNLGKRNAADLKAEERHLARLGGCVAKRTDLSCAMTCDSCPLNTNCLSHDKATNGAKCRRKCEVCSRSVSRHFELDRPSGVHDDGSETYVDLPDETTDILAILEDRALLDTLISALDKLAPDDRELWNCLVKKVKKQDIADRFQLTLDGVYYREQRLKSNLRSDEALKSFYSIH